jgi:hypothetical protein
MSEEKPVPSELKAASASLIPASITLIPPAHDLDYAGSGAVTLSGSAEYFWGVSSSQSFSWRISGVVESAVESSWSVGEGEYYWYRIEGECGEVECDTFGVQTNKCKKMTFTTVISARNLTELCENMQSPVINPPVQARITSVQRYSRTASRTASPLDCNIIQDVDFCQIPECLDYCVYERAVVDIPLQFIVYDSPFQVEGSGSASIGGSALDVVSPTRQYVSSGNAVISGSADFGFEDDLGLIVANFNIATSVFGFNFDFDASQQTASSLTISDSSVIACGCSAVGLSLTLRHNLSQSSLLSGFADRSGISLPSTLYLRHRSSDSSWRDVQRIVGRNISGGQEQISLFFGLECVSNYWRFSFVARSSSSGETKILMEIPSSLLCENGNVSADILADIRTGNFTASNGEQIYVVTPHSIRPPIVSPTRGLDVTVGGVSSGYVVYYDNMGIFSDEYWSNFPFELRINPTTRPEMAVMNLQSIF